MNESDYAYQSWKVQQKLDRRGDPSSPPMGWDALCQELDEAKDEIRRLTGWLEYIMEGVNRGPLYYQIQAALEGYEITDEW